MLFVLLLNENINIILHHKRLLNKLIKHNILTIDLQISDKTGTIIRDFEENIKQGNKILHKILVKKINNKKKGS